MEISVGEEGADKLRQFIVRQYLPRRARPLADDEPLISSGIIDSLGLVDLTVFVEEEFGVFLGPDHFGRGRADTMGQVLQLIARHR
jgi:acyl carrier protein